MEILRALARDADLIVLDEPSASLSAKEVERLHEVVRGLRARGHTVILVSHFLGEVLDLSDVVTVLRDGRVVRTGPIADETEASLVTGMLGRPVSRTYPREAAAGARCPGRASRSRACRPRASPTCPSPSGRARSSAWPGWSAPAGPSSPGRSTGPIP